MTCKEMIGKLMKLDPDAQYLLKSGTDWLEVVDVQPTGEHRNAVCAVAMDPSLGGGVIIVPPDHR